MKWILTFLVSSFVLGYVVLSASRDRSGPYIQQDIKVDKDGLVKLECLLGRDSLGVTMERTLDSIEEDNKKRINNLFSVKRDLQESLVRVNRKINNIEERNNKLVYKLREAEQQVKNLSKEKDTVYIFVGDVFVDN